MQAIFFFKPALSESCYRFSVTVNYAVCPGFSIEESMILLKKRKFLPIYEVNNNNSNDKHNSANNNNNNNNN